MNSADLIMALSELNQDVAKILIVLEYIKEYIQMLVPVISSEPARMKADMILSERNRQL